MKNPNKIEQAIEGHYAKSKHHRRSIRLKNYDYSRAGAYFITICTYNRECLFGDISDGKMILNELGQIVADEWGKTPKIRPNIALDAFIVMPNHIHGIAIITESHCRGVLQYAPTKNDVSVNSKNKTEFKSPSQTIGAVTRGYKSSVTKQINILRQQPGAPVWQRNYFERVIRNEHELNRIREYIITNPFKWDEDENNPGIKFLTTNNNSLNTCKRKK